MSNKEFPDELKLADVTPTYKKDDPNKSKNYRPASVLLVFSKVFWENHAWANKSVY